MKRLIITLATVLASIGAAFAQQPVPPCDITITGNFDSECIYDFKEEVTDEYPDLMVACKHSAVIYTAHANNGSITPTGYTWEIFGDVTHTASGDHVLVSWGDGPWGMVIVNVVGADGDTCTKYSRVKLIDNPTAGVITIPAYTVTPSGDKVVYVCEGSTVQFIDNSTADGSDIAGYQWESGQAPQAATPNYTIDNVMMADRVTHTVYNNCGCYDSEDIYIELLEGDVLELDCYGTVCEGATMTYTATSPTCYEYHWYVEGGTIIGGQGTATPTVQWDRPRGGYGVIGLDGVRCGGVACPAMLSRRVPVIQSGLAIKGETDVCIGDAVLYTLPVLGSTKYKWSVTPATGVDTTMKNNTSEMRLVFNAAGTYTIGCSYICDFLGCGPYEAEPITVTVKPELAIAGNNRICVTNACGLQTSPAVSADWTAYDLSNGNAVVATATGTTFTHTFGHAGRYMVTAANSAYCGPASFVLNVMDTPPAPTVDDMDPDNRHTACPYSGIALAGTPSQPNYSLVWAPACTTASPQMFCADNVTISYQAEVCDVRVYNYDRVLQCRSTNYYVHQVSELTPDPLSLPSPITVCPGSTIHWGDAQIPDQSHEAMLYDWTIQENKQYCASVVGNHMDNSVTLVVNETSPMVTPFTVNLRRTYCGNSVSDTAITINVRNHDTCALWIAGPDTVCMGSNGIYTGGSHSAMAYQWSAEDDHYTGNPFDHTFQHEGVYTVALHGNPYTYCTNAAYLPVAEKEVVVASLPMVESLYTDLATGNISVVPALSSADYDFAWTYRYMVGWDEEPLNVNANMITAQGNGTYSCTVTSKATHCSKTVSTVYSGQMQPSCNSMTLTGDYDVCSHTLSLTASHYSPFVIWSINGGDYSKTTSGTGDRNAEITFENIGVYTVEAHSGIDACYTGKRVQTVDFIPRFEFVPGCDKIVVKNHSQYALPGGMVYITVTSDCPSCSTGYMTIAVDDTSEVYVPASFTGVCTFTFTLTGYGTNGNITPCVLGSAAIGHPVFPTGFIPVSITSAGGNQTCNNTPTLLTAALNYTGASVVSTEWDFGDNSGLAVGGASVYHTYEDNLAPYYIVATTTDNHGCEMTSAPLCITSQGNPFTNNAALTQLPPMVCPIVSSIRVLFSPGVANNYEWWRLKAPTHIANGNPYHAYYPDDYFVYAVNSHNCKTHATSFVKFLNVPTASIYVEKTGCCVGEEVTLYGGQDAGGDAVTYQWSVSGGGLSLSATTPNITFTPPAAGTYSVSLTVTGTTGCSSTATETITASTPAAAPSLSFVGSPCISDAPVQLSASGCSGGEVHWSNGNTGTNAYYYTPGIATAYCYDPAVGCPSKTAQIRIDRQPDFDALLTGCYRKCRDFFDRQLPVYGLTCNGQTISWDWRKNGVALSTGSGVFFDDPLMLPLTGFGSYRLHVGYAGGLCSETSPSLDISDKQLCDCDSVSVSYVMTDVLNERCSLSCKIRVTVCNNSETQKACFGSLLHEPTVSNCTVSYTNFATLVLDPGDCYSFDVVVDVLGLIPSSTTFRLVDQNCMYCEKVFYVNLMPELPYCGELYLPNKIHIVDALTNETAVYFHFAFDLEHCGNLLALWSEPPMIVDYLQTGTQVAGLGTLDMATLTQLADAGENVCFHAVVCCDGVFCHKEYCMTAAAVLVEVAAAMRQSGDSTMMAPRPEGVGGGTLRLTPNPATGLAEVTGTADEVVEIVLMDMSGRRVAAFGGDEPCDISGLPSGAYIARVATRKKQDGPLHIDYLKLVKK